MNLKAVASGSGPDCLVTIAWVPDAKTYRICGRVTLDPGVGQHIVDVTDPAAPCLIASPAMFEWLRNTPL